MPDDLIDLLPKEPQKDLGKPDPRYDSIEPLSLSPRDSGTAFFIDLAVCFIPIGIAIFTLRHRPGGWPITAAIGYTLIIPYILSNRYLGYVPWDILRRHWKKFLLVHCMILLPVCEITSIAFAAKSRLPEWFLTSGRYPAPFYYCLGGILLAMALWECSWITKHEKHAEGS
jgi:hypothetical protein